MEQTGPREVIVHRAPTPIQLDGRVDKAVWQGVTPVIFDVPREFQKLGQSMEERGSARLLWDDRFLYIAIEFTDSDLVALGKEDDEEHHSLGDVAEIFLKPAEQPWYWEFHVTPGQHASTYWHVGRGRFSLREDRHVRPRFFDFGVQLQGTLNNWRDRDKGWTAEVAIPFDKLDRDHERSSPRENWTILLARYNYTRYRTQATGPELSSWPCLSRASFHLVDEYAQLRLVP
jgi:hypothetical protein